jgi:hypothetical protein
MVDRTEPDETAVRYLLGTATEQEKTVIEETLFKDPAALEEVAAVEDELIDDYLSGELTGDERSAFESAYFATAERRERINFARMLRQRLAGTGAKPPLAPPRTRGRAVPSPIFLAAAAVLFAILAFVFGMDSVRAHRQVRELLAERSAATQRELELSRQVGEAQAQAERLDRQVAQERSETERLSREIEDLQTSAAKTASLTLIAGLVRGGGNVPAVRVAPDTVSLRLTAPMQVSYPSYRAAVQTPEGKTLWRGPARPAAAGGGPSISVTVPGKDLPPGDYILSVTGVTTAGREEPAADFSFRVKKP